MTFQVTHNLPEFRADIKDIGFKFGRKAVRFATAGAAREFRDAAKANAPKRTGLLKRAIYSGRSRSRSRGGKEVHIVSVRAGNKKKTSNTKRRGLVITDAYYWHWVEAGHKARDGSQVEGQKFLQKAFNSTQTRSLVVFDKRLTLKIAELKKQSRTRVRR